MRVFLVSLILIIINSSCANSANNARNSNSHKLKQNKELQFTFLIFDKSKTDIFFSRYNQFDYTNKYFKEDISMLRKWKFSNNIQNGFKSFKNNTESPDYEDFEIALDELDEKYFENNKEYFEYVIQFVFFYECLPTEIQNKWTQTFEGDFKFDATFFSLLRQRCQIIDKMIYGEIGCWDKNLEPIFYEHIFNEITPERAIKIKALIEKDQAFDDLKFQLDRKNFIYLLDKTIDNEWRLILTDWN